MKTSAAQQLESADIPEPTGVHAKNTLAHRDLSLIRDVSVNITAKLGTASLTVEKLFSLKAGDIVELEQHLDEMIVFYMDDKPIARGNLVVVEDNYGVEIVEIL